MYGVLHIPINEINYYCWLVLVKLIIRIIKIYARKYASAFISFGTILFMGAAYQRSSVLLDQNFRSVNLYPSLPNLLVEQTNRIEKN